VPINPDMRSDASTRIIDRAKAFGASLAGITTTRALSASPSYDVSGKSQWSLKGKSLLVIALAHLASRPELDRWDANGSPGDRELVSIANRLAEWLMNELSTEADVLPYHVGRGGIFLKDAATVAGLGAIGENNLLITREFGPRVRFRALMIDLDLKTTGRLGFEPCKGCDMPRRRLCPQSAFQSGSYDKTRCYERMAKDEASKRIRSKGLPNTEYCRTCELACTAGSDPGISDNLLVG
jgi:epoxyqueuosine reductase